MQTTASKNTFIKLQKALNDANEYGRRHDYAWRFSNGRTESTKELTDREAWAIMQELAVKFGIDITDELDKMRKKIIATAHLMGWQVGNKVDMARLNAWCSGDKGPYHKPLNNHNRAELIVLVGVFEKVYKDYLNKL